MNPQSSSVIMPNNKPRKPQTLILIVALIVALIFGIWAFSQSQSSKSNTAKKVAAAISSTKTTEDAKITTQFTDQLQQPYKIYTSSASNGSISFSYPKTYSAYVDETDNSEPINGYFYPNAVPGLQSNTSFALRAELLSTAYNQVLDQFTSDIQSGSLSATAYIPTKMAAVKNVQAGTRLVGVVGQDQNSNNQNGSIVIIPVRDKTLKIYTESNDFLSDFNNIVLPTLTFAP